MAKNMASLIFLKNFPGSHQCSKDVWMCSIPAVWCRLLWDAALTLKSQKIAPKPIFAYLGRVSLVWFHGKSAGTPGVLHTFAMNSWGFPIDFWFKQTLAGHGVSDEAIAAGRLSGLPLLQYVRDGREDFLRAFVEMGQHERNIVAANNAYLAEQDACLSVETPENIWAVFKIPVDDYGDLFCSICCGSGYRIHHSSSWFQVEWQTGLKVPTLRIHGLHTNATYVPLRSHEANAEFKEHATCWASIG